MKKLTEQRKGIIALVFLAFIFASMGIFVRYLRVDFTLFQQTYLRIFLAFVLGSIFFFREIRWSNITSVPSRDWLVIVFRALTLYGGILAISQAFLTTKYSNTTFIASAPLLPLLGYFLLKEKINLQKVLWIGLSFVGIAIIGVQDPSHLFDWGEGELLALLSAVLFSLSYVGRKWQTSLLTNKETTVLMFLTGSVLLFAGSVFMLHESLPTISAFSTQVLVVLLFAGLFNVANLLLTNYGFEKVEVHVAGNILNLETFFALVFGIVLYHEAPALHELLGGALIVLSAYQMNKLVS